MAIEYELKFRATPQILKAVEGDYPCYWETIEMETAYYDTPSASLSARRYTLRQRLENGIPVCTLKVPMGDARGEWEIKCDSMEEAIGGLIAMGAPAELAELTREGLVHICGAKFTRRAKQLHFPEGSVELALDHGHLYGSGYIRPLCEVEIELKSGSPLACQLLAKELINRFALQPEEKSKFARALALYKGEQNA